MKASHVLRALALLGTAAALGCGSLTDPKNPPGAPGELVAVGQSRTSIELSWAAPASGSVGEFEIERATSTGDFARVASAGGSAVTYVDEGLDQDTRYRYRVRACNDGGCSDYTAVATARTFGVLTIATGSLPDGAVGQPYTQAIVAAEAGDSYEFALVAGALPAGLALDATSGIISGTPETEEVAGFTVRVTSIDGQTAERAFTLEIVAALPVVIQNIALPPVIVGGSYDVTLKAAGGGASFTWSVVAGSLPAGLTLDPAGRIHGTPTAAGSSTLTLQVESIGQTDQAEFTLAVVPHNTGRFDVTTLPVTPVPSNIQPHVDAALARWEAVITGDVSPLTIPTDAFASGACGGFGEAVNGTTLDDIIMMINIGPIDGPGSILGQAGPCAIRTGGADATLPLVGFLTLDSDDLEPLVGSETLTALIFHEMGHILGFGTLWSQLSLIEGAGTNAPAYTGSGAVTEYQALGGSGTTVPLENTGGSGTAESHWRESVFGDEIMTGYAEQPGVDQPLSRVTIASMQDLGYAVDLTEADPFVLAAGLVAGVREDIGFDVVYRGPLLAIGPDGRVRVRQPAPPAR